MHWGFFARLFTLNMITLAFANASAVSETFESAQMRLQMQDHSVVRLYFPEQNVELQNWIDEKTTDLLKTAPGLALCHQVLGANTTALQNYLAISAPAATQIALNCATHEGSHNFVDDFTVTGPIKMTKSVAFQRRHYQFLLTDENKWPFDSWTDAATNQTVLVLPKKHGQDPNVFLQMLAHELAIYFDGQYSVGTQEWWSLHANKKFTIVSADRERLFFAVNNPVIAAILSYMRAFRVEQEMMKELLEDRPETVAQYDELAFQFLSYSCDHDCLMNFVKAQSMALSPYALALTAYSGSYKNKKIKELEASSPILSYRASILSLSLDSFDRHFIKKTKYNVLPFISIIDSMNSWLPRQFLHSVQELFETKILPEDFKHIEEAKVFLADSNETISFLQWILQPVLSGRNVDFSSGPRPRIRTGGGGYGN